MKYLDDLKLLEKAAKEVAPIIMEYFGADAKDLEVESKAHAGFSPVTIADKKADAFLQEFLLKSRPDYGWLSEEIEDNAVRLSKKNVFIVDPIDGTKPFIKGKPEFAVSIAIVEDGKPVVGVVFNPAKNDMYSGAKGLGVFVNGKKIDVINNKSPVGEQECLVSYSELRRGLWDIYKGKFLMKPIGSIAYKLALIAAGESDFMVTLRPKSEWDCAAGHILCLESGLVVSDIHGENITYNNISPDGSVDRMIVASKNIYSQVKDIINF